MEQRRKGEKGHTPFRSDRFFNANGFWYFMTREGTQEGPFDNRDEANAALMMFIRNIVMGDQRILGATA